jgi:hypothetical protein
LSVSHLIFSLFYLPRRSTFHLSQLRLKVITHRPDIILQSLFAFKHSAQFNTLAFRFEFTRLEFECDKPLSNSRPVGGGAGESFVGGSPKRRWRRSAACECRRGFGNLIAFWAEDGLSRTSK